MSGTVSQPPAAGRREAWARTSETWKTERPYGPWHECTAGGAYAGVLTWDEACAKKNREVRRQPSVRRIQQDRVDPLAREAVDKDKKVP